MEKVLIAGATGSTGKKVVKLLKDSGDYTPVAMIRSEGPKKQFENKGIETRLGDLEGNIDDIAKGMDKVVFAAGSNGKKTHAVDQEGAKKLIDAGKRANVSKFVMLSSMGADQPNKSTELKEYLKAKHNADEYLKASLLPYSVVRPGALTNEAGIGKIKAGKVLNENGSISRDDVAKTLVSSLSNDISRDSTFEILAGSTPIKKAVRMI